MDLGSNQLSGNLDSVEEMQYLHILRLDSNNFTGNMPMMSSPFLEVQLWTPHAAHAGQDIHNPANVCPGDRLQQGGNIHMSHRETIPGARQCGCELMSSSNAAILAQIALGMLLVLKLASAKRPCIPNIIIQIPPFCPKSASPQKKGNESETELMQAQARHGN